MDKKAPVVYKSLDTEKFIRRNGTDSLVPALNELDTHWKQVSDYASAVSKENKKHLADVKAKTDDLILALAEVEIFHKQVSDLSVKNNDLTVQNRYLRKMLRMYLYPAVANEILKKESILPESEPEAMEEAIHDLTEGEIPASFSESVRKDVALQLEEEQLIKKMWRLCNG